MSIKRRKVDSIDSDELKGATHLPDTLTGRKEMLPGTTTQTEIPQNRSDYSSDIQTEGEKKGRETIGRTWSDLLVWFERKPQFVPTILTIIGFLLSSYVFKDKIHDLPDLKYPLAISLCLNAVYYGISLIHLICTWVGRCFR